jgi:uncharacterized protein YbaR (Trm112 family)
MLYVAEIIVCPHTNTTLWTNLSVSAKAVKVLEQVLVKVKVPRNRLEGPEGE